MIQRRTGEVPHDFDKYLSNRIQTESAQQWAVETSLLALKRGEKLLFEKMTWKLPRGKFLAITGASGAGKSSLLACLGGIIAPAAGEFKFGVSDAREIGFIFQNFRLTANLSVLKNVLCGKLGAYNWWQTFFTFSAKDKQAAFAILRELGLDHLVHREVRKISGGEQQRTALARVLLQEPQIILADEPTSNLDAELAKKVLNVLREVCAKKKQTVIAVLHDERMVEGFADFELKIGAEHENGWFFREVPR